jgi:DNA-binding FrmR family transcriptional regulator
MSSPTIIAAVRTTTQRVRTSWASLTAEVLEGHVRAHIVDPTGDTKRARAAADLIEVLKTYVR